MRQAWNENRVRAHRGGLLRLVSRQCRLSFLTVLAPRLPEWNADVEAEGCDFIVMPELRVIHCVQFDAAKVVGDQRDHADKGHAFVVGLAVNDGKGAADPEALAKLELVAQRGELRRVCPGILVRTQLAKGDAPLGVGKFVVKSESGIDFVVQMLAVNGLAIRMVREPVDIEIERIEIESEICRPDL